MVTIAIATNTGRQSFAMAPKPTIKIRNIAPKAATLVHAAMNPVTGVGAP